MNGTIPETIAFDIYGTLIDTHGLIDLLRCHVGDNASRFSTLWRQKQLEYSFRRGLMRQYKDFGICTAQAFKYACISFGVSLSQKETDILLRAYRALPIFDDVVEGLKNAQDAGFRLYAFSNGKETDILQLLDNANIGCFFIDIISVDEVQSFKPDPLVYRHFLKRAKADNAWMVSANPFDIIGAVSAGMKSAWMQRYPDIIMDPWEIVPTVVIHRLNELVTAITSERNT